MCRLSRTHFLKNNKTTTTVVFFIEKVNKNTTQAR